MDKKSEVNRRKFMEVAIYTIGGTIAAASSVALATFAVGPSFKKEKGKWIPVEIETAEDNNAGFQRVVLEYEAKDGWLTSTERTLAYVKRTKENKIIAISADCTHLGCIVTWDEDQNIFKCPCHDGRYDPDGKVIAGPPPAPLYRHKTKIEDDRIFVSTQKVPYGGETSV